MTTGVRPVLRYDQENNLAVCPACGKAYTAEDVMSMHAGNTPPGMIVEDGGWTLKHDCSYEGPMSELEAEALRAEIWLASSRETDVFDARDAEGLWFVRVFDWGQNATEIYYSRQEWLHAIQAEEQA